MRWFTITGSDNQTFEAAIGTGAEIESLFTDLYNDKRYTYYGDMPTFNHDKVYAITIVKIAYRDRFWFTVEDSDTVVRWFISSTDECAIVNGRNWAWKS